MNGRALVLDRVAWSVLTEHAHEAGIWRGGPPPAFAAEWSPLAGGEQLSEAKASAVKRLREAGLLSGAVLAAQTRQVLGLFTGPVLGIRVRSWATDRAVFSEAAFGPRFGIALTRLQQNGSRPGQVDEASTDSGVELRLLDPDQLMDAVWRAVPPSMAEAVRPPGPDASAPSGLRTDLGTLGAVAAAVRRAEGAASFGVDAAVLAALLDDAGWDVVPSVLAELAERITAVLGVTVQVHAPALPDGAGRRVGVTWAGRWLTGGSRLVAVRPEPVPVGPVEVDLFAAAGTSSSQSVEPGVRLVEVDGAAVRRDILGALTEAWSSQAALWEPGVTGGR